MRRAILDAARDLFVSEGYQNVSIRKIADRIEYSPAAIYGYFGSKDDIFFALAEEGFERLWQTAASAPTFDDPVASLEARLWALYEFSKQNPEHFALMFMDRSVPRIRAHYEQFRVLNAMKESTAQLIQRCVDAGAFPSDTEPRATFRVLAAGLSGAAIVGLCHRLAPGENPDELARDTIALLLAGLKAGTPITFRASAFQCPLGADAEPVASAAAPSAEDEGVMRS